MSKPIVIALILILIASSGTAMQLTEAASTPSVPEFTVKQVDRSYDVPTTYTTNMYTGENITHPGYHVDKLTIDVTIKNQPFSRSETFGNVTGLFYNVQAKFSSEGWSSSTVSDSNNKYAVEASTSDYTVVTIVLGSEGWYVSQGSQIDIRVQAVNGTEYTVWSMGGGVQPIGTQFILDAASSWSSTKTITVGSGEIATIEPTPVPSQTAAQSAPNASATAQNTINPTETPRQPNTQTDALLGVTWKDFALVIACCVIAVLAIALVLSRRKIV